MKQASGLFYIDQWQENQSIGNEVFNFLIKNAKIDKAKLYESPLLVVPKRSNLYQIPRSGMGSACA